MNKRERSKVLLVKNRGNISQGGSSQKGIGENTENTQKMLSKRAGPLLVVSAMLCFWERKAIWKGKVSLGMLVVKGKKETRCHI